MSEKKQRLPVIYFDSCVFISFLKGKDEIHRAETVLKVLEDAKNGKIDLYTSHAGIAECPLADRPLRRNLNGRDIVEIFFEQKFIRKVQVDKKVAFRSREIQRMSRSLNPQKPILKPMDAIHVASATLYGEERLFTYDGDHLMKYDGHPLAGNIPICEPCRYYDLQGIIPAFDTLDVNSLQQRSNALGLEAK